MYTRTIEFLEYFPPPKASAVTTPTTSTAALPNPAKPAAVPVDPALAAALKKAKNSLDDFGVATSDS